MKASKNKDIYSTEYSSYSALEKVLSQAEDAKEDATFVKEQHVDVLDETDEYIFLVPKTHRGSLKYGSGTKWCTASKKDEGTFKRYTKGGLLAYLIRKKPIGQNTAYDKVAFFSEEAASPITGHIKIYNSKDTEVTDFSVINGSWKIETILKLILIYRNYFINWKEDKKSKDEIEKYMDLMQQINFESLNKNIKTLTQKENTEFVENFKSSVNNFINQLNNFNNGTSKTKN